MTSIAADETVDTPARSPGAATLRYCAALRAAGFTGEVEDTLGQRLVTALDNSIYRVVPEAVLFPRTPHDIGLAARVLASGVFEGVSLTARGGGTGTNGQSLSDSVLIDTSRHLRGILDFDPEGGTVTVEPGVVLDQLNDFLSPHGWFFPPSVSTSSRATIGGMVATDASGKGSRRYGRTSDYVLALDLTLADGTDWTVRAPNDQQPPASDTDTDLHDRITAIRDLLVAAAPVAAEVFPAMNRGLTGYNLRDAVSAEGKLNLCKLLAGSEGTLALTRQITLRVLAKPKTTALVAVFYEHFHRALEIVPHLVKADPLAIEILDDKILELARGGPLWARLGSLFGMEDRKVGAVLFCELAADSEDELARSVARLDDAIAEAGDALVSKTITDRAAMSAAWSLRQGAVGLLGAFEIDRAAVAFVEDTAVPPERLAPYVAQFRALLDRHGIDYGMFGHADVGCLHVRPALDMRRPEHRNLIRTISEEVVALTRAHGGLIWGEHGRGFRGEFSPRYFGPELYQVVREIKAILDPLNQLNPGKLAAPAGTDAGLRAIDGVPFRGERDALIPASEAAIYANAVRCNGNGACHGYAVTDAMCPSYQVSRDKTQSPNGRAALLREWALQPRDAPDPALTNALDQSLATCLSCRSCASQCPVKVDIPTMKARYLEQRYAYRIRPARDWAMRWLEPAMLLLRHVPRLANAFMHNPVSRTLAARTLNLVDIPTFAALPLEKLMGATQHGLPAASLEKQRSRKLVLVADSFTGVYEPHVIVAASRVLGRLGLEVSVTPIIENGKALELRGFLVAYERVVARTQKVITRHSIGADRVIGIEPATTVRHAPDKTGNPEIVMLDLVLDDLLKGSPTSSQGTRAQYTLLLHCSERAADPNAADRWVRIFDALGANLTVPDTGCCGMSGLFGHEREHKDQSRAIFGLSWEPALKSAQGEALATGFSCRSQASRFSRPLRHPIEVVLDLLLGQNEDTEPAR